MSSALAAGDIVLVKFPYADRNSTKYRPALVVSDGTFHVRYSLCWVVMITSAVNTSWPGDLALEASSNTGLASGSIIRPAKLATIDLVQVEKIGYVPAALRKRALTFIRKQFA